MFFCVLVILRLVEFKVLKRARTLISFSCFKASDMVTEVPPKLQNGPSYNTRDPLTLISPNEASEYFN